MIAETSSGGFHSRRSSEHLGQDDHSTACARRKASFCTGERGVVECGFRPPSKVGDDGVFARLSEPAHGAEAPKVETITNFATSIQPPHPHAKVRPTPRYWPAARSRWSSIHVPRPAALTPVADASPLSSSLPDLSPPNTNRKYGSGQARADASLCAHR